MRISAQWIGLEAALDHELQRCETAVTAAMHEAAAGLKEELRDATFRELGLKLAYTWAAEVYPKSGTSLGAAAYVYSKAPRIMDFFTAHRVVTPLIGDALAIPSRNVPRSRGKGPLSPVEVEARFNAELQPRKLRSGNIGLFIDVVGGRRRSGSSFRRATRGRRGQGRKVQSVLMFTLVRSVANRHVIDLKGPAARWSARIPGLVEKHLGAAA